MPIVTAKKIQQISESKDPKQGILDAVGSIEDIEICGDLVLLGTYIAPNKIGGILLPDKTVGEDEFQGKIGLVLKMGPLAFQYGDYEGPKIEVGDWVIFWTSDAKQLTINETPCRLLRDDQIRMRIANPRALKVS